MDIIPNEIKKKIFLFWAEHPTAIIIKKALTILDRGSYSYRIFNINGRKDIIFSEDNSDRDFQEEFWNNLIGYIRLHKELQEHWRISREVDEMSRNDKDVKYTEHKTARILRNYGGMSFTRLEKNIDWVSGYQDSATKKQNISFIFNRIIKFIQFTNKFNYFLVNDSYSTCRSSTRS